MNLHIPNRLISLFLLLATLGLAGGARADFHFWQVEHIYSDATGAVQYIQYFTSESGQQFLAGHTLQASSGGVNHNFQFPANLPGDTANRRFLVATQSFAALGLVTPDYVIPDGFLFRSNATISLIGGPFAAYATLPADGIHAVEPTGSSVAAMPTNFAGVAAALPLLPTGGLWAIDAENNGQPGRGFTIEVRGGLLVMTVFGYDGTGAGSFYQCAAYLTGGNFSSTLNRYQGGMSFGGQHKPAMSAGAAGTAALAFTDAGHGTVTFPGEAAKAISKFNWSAEANAATGVPASGLWAVTDEINGQPGRGFTLEVQGNVLVMTMFAYTADGHDIFYQTAGQLTGGAYTGRLDHYQNGTTFGGTVRSATLAGSAGDVVLNFTDATHGTVQFPGESQKAISKLTW